MLRIIGIIVAVLLAAVLIIAATRPDTFRVQRSATKVISVFVSMDRMVGKDFETGLANLKAVAEG